VGVVRVRVDHKAGLAQRVQLYLHDFSEIRPYELTAHGTYTYLWLDNYFTEASRYPFFLVAGDRLAGFALMRRVSGVNELAEFFVVRRYRRQGVGRTAATRLFRKYPGRWSLEFDHANGPASVFWPKVVGEVAVGSVRRTEQYPPKVDYPSTLLEFETA